MLMPVAILAILILICFWAKEDLVAILKIDSVSLLLLLIYSYASSLLILYQSRLALDYDYSEYLKLSLFNAIFSVLLSVVLIETVYAERRYLGRIVGGTVTYVLIALYVWRVLSKKAKPRYNKRYWKYGLKISLPLIPHGLAQILLLSFDRIMINLMIGSAEAGVYSFAYTIYSLVSITATSLDTVYSTWVFKKMHEENSVKELRRIGTCFMLLIGGTCVVTMLIAPEIIYLLGGNKYKEAIYSTIPVLLAGFFAMIYCVPAVMEYYYEQTKYISLGTAVAAAINLVLNYIFIPRYGYIAAAYTTLISYIVYFMLHVYISKHLTGFSVIIPKYFCRLVPMLMCAYWVGLRCHQMIWIRFIVLVLLVLIGIVMLHSLYGTAEIKRLYERKKNER